MFGVLCKHILHPWVLLHFSILIIFTDYSSDEGIHMYTIANENLPEEARNESIVVDTGNNIGSLLYLEDISQ